MRYLVFIFFLIACKERSNDNCNHKIEYKSKKIEMVRDITLSIDRETNYMTTQTIVYGDTLYRANYFKPQIDIFSLKTKQKVDNFSFKTKGPNSIKRFGGSAIALLKKDDFLIGNLYSDIYYTNKDSILFSININNQNLLSGKEYSLYATNENKPIVTDSLVYFYKVSQYPQTDKRFFDEKLIFKYNPIAKSFKELNISYPEAYKKGFWSFAFVHPSFTINKSKLVISFPIGSGIYIYDTKTETTTKVSKCLKSKFDHSSEATPLKTNNLGFYEKNKNSKTQTKYTSIDYDPVKNVYYRLVELPATNDIDINSAEKDFLVCPLVLMVLDSEFNIIAEKKLNPKIFNRKDYFINKEGFWLSKNNPNNKNFNENQLTFTLFIIE